MTYTDTLPVTTLRRFPKDQRDLIEAALKIGWKGRILADGGARLVPPDDAGANVTPVYVPMTQVHSSRIKGLQRAVAKLLVDELTPDDPPDPPEVIVPHLALGVVEVAEKDHVVTVAPYLARASRKRGDAVLYASSVVLERTWASGKKDWACSWEGCDYTAVKPKSIASHYAAHKTKAIIDRTKVAVEPNSEPIYDTAQARLAKEIETAIGDGDLDWGDKSKFAAALAGRIVTARRLRGAAQEPHDDEPLVPEALLQRLRNLLLPQEIVNRENLNAQVQALATQVSVLEEQNSRLTERMREKQSTLATLSALIEDIRKEGEGEDGSQDSGPVAPSG